MPVLDVRAQLTLVELAKRTHNKDLLLIAETLNEVLEMLDDAIWIEANGPTSHTHTRRQALPTGTYRKFNAGVPREASAAKQIVETLGMLEAYSVVDKGLVDLAPNAKEFRSGEDMAFVEGLSQTFATTLIYGNMTTTPEKFNGLATRYNSLSLANVDECGGTGETTTSVWVIQWGKTRVFLPYPKGSKTMGVNARDLGECTVVDAGGTNEYQAYRTHFKMDGGIVVRDDRCVQRVCNIQTTGKTNIFDDDILVGALNRLPAKGIGAAIYANETVKTQMDILAKDKSNVNYTQKDAFGRPVTSFRGFPVRQMDAIINTEDAVV